jgi:uncharacterized lipoprotein YddW (UPF0748 family)
MHPAGVACRLTLLVACVLTGLVPAAAAPTLKGRAVWAHPRDAGTTEASVKAFVDRLAAAHVNTVVMEVKTAAGIFWPSQRFSAAVVPAYREFDFPAVLVREAHVRRIQVHAWFFDFAEGGDSPVVQEHPEWLARNPTGLPTTAEVLRGQPYRLAWMCPARRPGYTDQWLIPLIVEFASRYEVDAIHHDYVRYQGDLAPDTYCFCDFCLKALPKYASYYSEVRPTDPLLAPMDRPHLEAHWEKSPRVIPPNWADYGREMQARFLLGGSFFPGGHYDLDYFFYEYRVHHVEQFTREVAEAVRKVRPGVEFSAAVFRNPVQSGRFLGQDWRRFSPWVQYLMPMDYRSHYAGDLNAHLELLAESIQQQKAWARDFPHLWIGVAAYQLYDEERQPLADLRTLIRTGGPSAAAREALDKVSPRLRTVAPDLHAGIESYLREARADATLAARLDTFLASPPPGFYPPERFLKTLEAVRAQEVEGIVVFSTSFLTSGRLWEALGRFFEE